MSEQDLIRQVDSYLKARDLFIYRNNTGRRGHVTFGKVGSPDFIGLLPTGQFIGIELKTKTGKQSKEQVEFQENVIKNNGIYILAHSFDEFLSEIEKVCKKRLV